MSINNLPISIIILTLNEEIHIERAITNVKDWANEIVILDSLSSDKTCDIAKQLGVSVFQRKFDNYANQRNYAIKEMPTKNEWVLFLDADEILTEELKIEITSLFESNLVNHYDGYYLNRRSYFMGRWMKHGGCYPVYILRLFKKDRAFITREMNEHITIEGKTSKLKYDFIDKNRNDFAFWLEKHNKYSTFEALELLKNDADKTNQEKEFADFLGSQAQRKRWIRERIWNKLPLFIRPFLYFFYRYIIRLGFLDGIEGFIFHFYIGLVFFIVVDAKYLQMKKKLYNQ